MAVFNTIQQGADAPPVSGTPLKRYVFLLLDQFSPLGFTCAIEALSAANGYMGQSYYTWTVLSEDGAPVTGTNGLSINVDGALMALNRHDTIVVCGGPEVASNSTLKILNWLRCESRKGVICGAIGSAAYTLAIAGLLRDKDVTTHWDYHTSFAELFPEITLKKSIFSIDRNRFTCAGGAASMDMMLHLIARDNGQPMAAWVADRMVYTSPRPSDHTQRLSIHCQTGVRHDKFARAIALMSANTETPLPHNIVAREVGISTRQLERLFKKHLNTSPRVYYMQLRLEKARNLLVQTNMAIAEITLACGFNAPSHFSKCYRRQFGVSPSSQLALN